MALFIIYDSLADFRYLTVCFLVPLYDCDYKDIAYYNLFIYLKVNAILNDTPELTSVSLERTYPLLKIKSAKKIYTDMCAVILLVSFPYMNYKGANLSLTFNRGACAAYY